MMPKAMRTTLLVTDYAMLIYWGVLAASALGIAKLPAAAMYDGYGTPIIDAWNWSFAPLDILFSVAGLVSVRLSSRGDPRWRGWAIASVVMTGCAGLMAVSFWALRGEFDPSWWIPNLALMGVACFWLPSLIRGEP